MTKVHFQVTLMAGEAGDDSDIGGGGVAGDDSDSGGCGGEGADGSGIGGGCGNRWWW